MRLSLAAPAVSLAAFLLTAVLAADIAVKAPSEYAPMPSVYPNYWHQFEFSCHSEVR